MTPEIEQKSPREIEQLQAQKLQEALVYLQEHSPFYQKRFKALKVDISRIKTLAQLAELPITTKEDLQLYNDDFRCVPRHKIIDYVTTSGTMGKPVTFALTDSDLDRLAYNEAISFACAGIKEGDVVQLMTTMDRRFMAGLAYFLGIRKLGAGIIRVGNGIPELQWDSIQKFKPTYLVAVPSFLLKLIAYAETHGIDYNASSIRGAICIGESLQNDDFTPNLLATKIKDKWNIDLFSTYASTEMSTAFTDCTEHLGGHHHPELIIVEILDDDNTPVDQGTYGELTITTLGVEGMPLLRFKTGDIVKSYPQGCACGRNTLRLSPVKGRKKQMVKYKGTTLYPPAIYDVLNNMDVIYNYLIEISENSIGTDEILIKIGVKDPSDDVLQAVKDHCRAKLRVLPTIELHPIEAIKKMNFPAMSRKPILFIDKRQQVVQG